MKELLNGKHKFKDDENVALAEECSTFIPRKLPPKLTDPGRLTIHFSTGSLKVGQELCDLGVNINLIPLSMMRILNCEEPKPMKMTLTLADRSITYPYGVLEDVLVRVDDFFPVDFVILDMPKDIETPLLLGRSLLATRRALIDVKIGELILKFNK
ncbi:uncharacterized protein LOC127104192 [Lathyrus oleraceus]|uniref:uncharacterized protein LOC127104192 n=1 Tax=Pisum sativum TaxID=3888 RepID=UPI0021D15589|nr:uncharacterized protein LOC127104192 [Pisum sativum]